MTPIAIREAEAARMVGVSVAALRRWRREHRGPAYVKLEGCIRYRVADLKEFLDRNTVNCGQSAAFTLPRSSERTS